MPAIFDAAYKLFGVPASLALGPCFLASERGRVRLSERYGFWGVVPKEVLWFHGASNGEVRGLAPIIKGLAPYHSLPTLLTATSPSGIEFGKELVTAARALPFDALPWVQRATSRIDIKCLIVGETEIWPVLYGALARRDIPIYLVNARISEYSLPHYRLFKPLLREVLAKVEAIYTGDAISADRFVDLGAEPGRVTFIGNSKYDSTPKIQSRVMSQEFRQRLWRDDKPVLVLGSIRPGEEPFWFKAIADFLGQGAAFNVIVAPRHKEKFDYFVAALQSAGLPFSRWSVLKEKGDANSAPVVVLDTFGDLEATYSFASLAFIGASMINIGGHNPLEASAYGVPVAMGKFYGNVKEIVDDLLPAQAMLLVETESDVRNAVSLVASRSDRLVAMGERAQEIWRRHSGSTVRIISELVAGLARRGIILEAHSAVEGR